jgi:XTP/dITP diphosphohydrolase
MIHFVTGNKGKFVEASGILGDLIQSDIGYTEIQADTLEEVAAFGMKEVLQREQDPVMLEDAGLFIEALGGFPGVYSAYAQKTIGNYAEPGQETRMFAGEVHGMIGFEARGTKGFGYDPIFYVGDRSLGEMELEEKNRISHRAKSMRVLKEWLVNR